MCLGASVSNGDFEKIGHSSPVRGIGIRATIHPWKRISLENGILIEFPTGSSAICVDVMTLRCVGVSEKLSCRSQTFSSNKCLTKRSFEGFRPRITILRSLPNFATRVTGCVEPKFSAEILLCQPVLCCACPEPFRNTKKKNSSRAYRSVHK